MALLWCDGFDHYGTGSAGAATMLDGPYAEVQATAEPRTTRPRTGTHSFFIAPGGIARLRRVFGADKSVAGVGYAAWWDILPNANANSLMLAQFTDNANVAQVSICPTTTGQIEARTGSISGTVIGTSGVVLTAAAYQHIEIRVDIDSSAGAVEVRVNGVTVLDLSNVDTRGLGTAQTAQVRIGKAGGNNTGQTEIYIDDLYAWDDQGGVVDDFVGDQRVFMLLPDQDTAESDWTRNTGANDFEAIDDAAPDDDTTYVAATTPAGSPPAPEASVFGLEDLPASVASVTALQAVGRLRKTDAGACNVQMSLVSADVGSPPAASEANGSDRPITEVYTYWQDVFHNDPATGAPWTPSAVNSAEIKIERTA